MMKNYGSKTRVIRTLILSIFLILFVSGCPIDDDDETEITICNLDNHEYDVELRRDSDDRVEDELHVEEWYELGDSCETFDDVDEGRYYLVVLDDDNDVVDESDDFYIDKGEKKVFNIDSDGDIIDDLHYHDKAIVSVCKLDDGAYRVALKRSSDDSLVADFSLEQWQESSNQCDDFEDLDEGRYYLEINDIGDNQSAGRSDEFYLEPRENKFVTIEPHGELVSD